MAKFTRMRDGVKRPAQFAGANVVGANVPGWRGKSFGISPADDGEVLVDDSGAGEINRLGAGGLAAVCRRWQRERRGSLMRQPECACRYHRSSTRGRDSVENH